jgi:large-conductance mechanosensitive channel
VNHWKLIPVIINMIRVSHVISFQWFTPVIINMIRVSHVISFQWFTPVIINKICVSHVFFIIEYNVNQMYVTENRKAIKNGQSRETDNI